MKPRAADLRTSPRVSIRMSAEVVANGRTFTATTRDLSTGGVCLEADRLLPEGQAVQIGLYLVFDDVEDSTQPPLEIRGKVAWAAQADEGTPAMMGIRFEGISSTQMLGLSKLLKQGSPPTPPPLPPGLRK